MSKGQGLAEYVLVLVLVALVTIAILTLFAGSCDTECEMERIQETFEKCLAQELNLTRDECFQMATAIHLNSSDF